MQPPILLKGPEQRLPVGVHFFDKDGHRREEVRLRWWDQTATTFRKPIYREQTEASSPQDPVEEDDAEDATEAPIGSKEFAFERDLRNYLSKNLAAIEPGLKVFQEEEFSGIE
jgi:hypothetical protein